jgi:SAM-dependent methyltransferase
MNQQAHFHRSETWDDFSRDYEEMAEPSTARFAIALAQRIGVAPGARVIDIGCGPGALALHLAGRGAEVTAIDHSPAMVARLRRRAQEQRLRIAAQAMDGAGAGVPGRELRPCSVRFRYLPLPRQSCRPGRGGAGGAARRPGRLGHLAGRFGAGPLAPSTAAFAELFPDRPLVSRPKGRRRGVMPKCWRRR